MKINILNAPSKYLPLCILFYLTVLSPVSPVKAQVWTYSYPNTIVNSNSSLVRKSTIYDVKVTQGATTQTCYVMYDLNQQSVTGNNNVKRNPDNHWTNFSLQGSATIEIQRLDGGNINSATVYPLKKGFTASISNNTATINIPAGTNKLQLWVDINGLSDQPLFIFVDPPETDVPDPNSSDVTVINPSDGINTVITKLNNSDTYAYFAPGIHQWGGGTGSDYDGYMLPIKANKRIYIPGGAYVIGSFSSEDTGGWKVYGRGVISGAGLDILPTAAFIPWSAVHHTGGRTGMTIEGIVSMCPPHFALTVRGTVDIDNVKMMSWWQSTDGTITGDNSTVNNCFFKVMDDGIKAYGNNCTHDNNTMYHQVNGAPVQFSWRGQHGDNNTVTNLYIINSIYKGVGATSNTAVISVVSHTLGQTTRDNTFDGIYIDNGCHRLLGMDASSGSYQNFTIKNVELNTGNKSKPQQANSYLSGNASFSNFDIINLKIDGQDINGTNSVSDQPNNGNWWFTGKTGALSVSQEAGGGNVPDITDLSVSALTCSSVTLAWSDVSGETAYRVRRKLPGESTFTNLVDVASNATTYTDNTVAENTSYIYQVRPVVNGTAIANSNQLSITTPGCATATTITVTGVTPGCNSSGNARNIISFSVSGGSATPTVNQGTILDDGNGNYRVRDIGIAFGSTTNYTISAGGTSVNQSVTAVSSCSSGARVASKTTTALPALTTFVTYPNPVKNELIFIKGAIEQSLSIEVIDVTGKIVLKKEVQDRLDVSRLHPGVFILRAPGFQPIRFVKQ